MSDIVERLRAYSLDDRPDLCKAVSTASGERVGYEDQEEGVPTAM